MKKEKLTMRKNYKLIESLMKGYYLSCEDFSKITFDSKSIDLHGKMNAELLYRLNTAHKEMETEVEYKFDANHLLITWYFAEVKIYVVLS